MSRPIVYGEPSQPNVRSVLFALCEKEVLFRNEPRQKIEPNASGPVYGEAILDAGGFVVEGVETILRFIAEGFSGPALQPDDARDRVRMNRALELNYQEAVTTLGSRIAGRYLAAFLTGEWIDPEATQSAIADARRTVAAFERILGNDAFLAGSRFSIADIAVGSLLAYVMEIPPGERIVPSGTAFHRWWERVSARNAFKATLRDGRDLFAFLGRS